MAGDRVLRSGAWQRLRRLVFARDGDVCHLCGEAGADSVDHVIPRKVAPELALEPSNLRPAHVSCNSARGAGLVKRAEKAVGW